VSSVPVFCFVSHHSERNSAFNLPLTLICFIVTMYHPSSSCSRFSNGHDRSPDHRFASHGRGNFGLRRDGLLSPVDDCPYGHPSPSRGGSYINAHVASADFDAHIHGFPDGNSDVARADFDAPFVAHPASADLDAPRSGEPLYDLPPPRHGVPVDGNFSSRMDYHSDDRASPRGGRSGDRHSSRRFGSGASRSHDYHSYQSGGSGNQNISRGNGVPIRSDYQLYHHRSYQRGGSDDEMFLSIPPALPVGTIACSILPASDVVMLLFEMILVVTFVLMI
jgi:hypothetical protein